MSNKDFEFFTRNFMKDVEFKFYGDEWEKSKLVGYDEIGDYPVFISEDSSRLRRQFVREIKEPEYIPYTLKTVPWPLSFKLRDDSKFYTAVQAIDDRVYVGDAFWLYEGLLSSCVHLDGSPCGVLKEASGDE